MKVKDALTVLKSAKKIVIGYGANALSFEMDDPLARDAYGDYVVDGIVGYDDGTYEINIAMRPVKEGVA